MQTIGHIAPKTDYHTEVPVKPEMVTRVAGGVIRFIAQYDATPWEYLGEGVCMMRYRCWCGRRLFFFPDDQGGGLARCGLLAEQPHPCDGGDACLDAQGLSGGVKGPRDIPDCPRCEVPMYRVGGEYFQCPECPSHITNHAMLNEGFYPTEGDA